MFHNVPSCPQCKVTDSKRLGSPGPSALQLWKVPPRRPKRHRVRRQRARRTDTNPPVCLLRKGVGTAHPSSTETPSSSSHRCRIELNFLYSIPHASVFRSKKHLVVPCSSKPIHSLHITHHMSKQNLIFTCLLKSHSGYIRGTPYTTDLETPETPSMQSKCPSYPHNKGKVIRKKEEEEKEVLCRCKSMHSTS